MSSGLRVNLTRKDDSSHNTDSSLRSRLNAMVWFLSMLSSHATLECSVPGTETPKRK